MKTELHQIITKDHLPLEGLLYKPSRKGWAAAVWLGGLTSRFSHSPERTHALAKTLNRNRIAFATFDHRGHGVISSIKKRLSKKREYMLGGTALERFEHCVFDIEAMIQFLKKRGYKKIFLLGHSTGANKSAYYCWKTHCRGISGVGLLGPLSDIPGIKEQFGKKYHSALRWAETMARRKKGNVLLPPSLAGEAFWAAQRFLSIAKEGTREDTFPYYNPRRRFYWAHRVRVPTLVLIGEKDQYADRPVPEILEVFRKQISSRWFTGKILDKADHGFTGKEKKLAAAVAAWIVSAQ